MNAKTFIISQSMYIGSVFSLWPRRDAGWATTMYTYTIVAHRGMKVKVPIDASLCVYIYKLCYTIESRAFFFCNAMVHDHVSNGSICAAGIYIYMCVCIERRRFAFRRIPRRAFLLREGWGGGRHHSGFLIYSCERERERVCVLRALDVCLD